MLAESHVSRRDLLAAVPTAVVAAALGASSNFVRAESPGDKPRQAEREIPWFPAQDPSRVREMVGVSHANLKRVKELLAESPDLSKATWDWGFGDWETAIGAASHTGQREIVAALIEHGARPDLFTFAMLGQLDIVRAYVAANPGIQRISGPHGITLMQHAQAGGEAAAAVVEYLTQLGNADIGPVSQPLSESDQRAYLGVYGFGGGADDFVEIALTKKGGLAIKRGVDGAPRNLTYLGEHAFHPAGAPAVRIRFDVSGDRASTIRVYDPGVILEGRHRPA